MPQSRSGKDATSGISKQVRNRGLIDAAEASVSKAKRTQGYQALVYADLEDLSYERIIVGHPDELSARELWYARRTLGEPNDSTRPPALTHSDVQARTESLLQWLKMRALANGGRVPAFTNAEAANAIGLGSLKDFGRVHGNIQSRLDFACYKTDLPPLGCAAVATFERAWAQDDRQLSFAVGDLQKAAQGRQGGSTILTEYAEQAGSDYQWTRFICSRDGYVFLARNDCCYTDFTVTFAR